jgi:hypothetical protein
MMDIDQVFRDAAPDAGGEATERIARGVLSRLGRRRRRARVLRGATVALVVATAVMVTLTTLDHTPPLAVPNIVRVEAPAPPAPAARKGWVQARKRPAKAAAESPAARAPLDDLRGRVRRETKHGDRSRLRVLAGEVARRGGAKAWPLLSQVIDALGPDAAAIEAAGEVGDPRAVPYLKRALRLADHRAALAADALRRIPGNDSLAALVEAHERMRGPEGELLPEIRARVALAVRAREDEVLGLLLDAVPSQQPCLLRTLAELRTPAALQAMVEALEWPALRPVARQLLARIAGKDLGAEPARWQRWLSTEAFGPAGPGADTRRLDLKSEKPIADTGRRALPWRWNA